MQRLLVTSFVSPVFIHMQANGASISCVLLAYAIYSRLFHPLP